MPGPAASGSGVEEGGPGRQTRRPSLPLLLLLAAAAAALLLAPPAAEATSQILSSRRVRVTAEPSAHAPRQGYLTLPLLLQNQTSTAQRVHLRFDSQPWAVVEAAVPLEPGERRTLPLLIPAEARHGSLKASDGYQDGTAGFSWSWSGTTRDAILVEGPGAAQAFAEEPRASDPLPVVAVARADMPETLPGLLGYKAVGLLESSLEELTEPQRRALEAWTALGGHLVLAQAPANPRTLLPLFSDASGRHAASGVAHPYGFGKLSLPGSVEACVPLLRDAPDLGSPAVAMAGRDFSAGDYAALALAGEDLWLAQGPLLDVARVPVGGFLLLVLAFVLVIGPGSFVLRARRGPHALLAFVPLTALATCGGIVAYGFLHEGLFTIHASSRTVTLLDGPRHRAVTLSVDAYYASLGPSSVRFGALGAVMPAGHARGFDLLRLDETDGLVFQGGLIPSRSYREHRTFAVAPSRARLSARREGGGLLVENSLGARVQQGLLRLGGITCLVPAVDEGGRAAATCDGGGGGDGLKWQLEVLRDLVRNRFRIHLIADSFLADLDEGEFLVALDRAVFAPDGGLELQRARDVQLVRGRLSP